MVWYETRANYKRAFWTNVAWVGFESCFQWLGQHGAVSGEPVLDRKPRHELEVAHVPSDHREASDDSDGGNA